MPCGLGTNHQQQAYAMTCRAALAVAVCLAVVAAACAVAAPVLALLAPLYFVAELLFAMIWYYRYLMLSYQPVKHRPLSHDPVSSFEKVMAHLKLFADIRHFLSIWWVARQARQHQLGMAVVAADSASCNAWIACCSVLQVIAGGRSETACGDSSKFILQAAQASYICLSVHAHDGSGVACV
jgi:hypothetical protein